MKQMYDQDGVEQTKEFIELNMKVNKQIARVTNKAKEVLDILDSVTLTPIDVLLMEIENHRNNMNTKAKMPFPPPPTPTPPKKR